MHHAQLVLYVRQIVHNRFRESGWDPDGPVHESILIQGGYYCGRRFVQEDGEAVWYFEDQQLKFYDAEGTEIEVMDIGATVRQARAA